MLKRLIVIALLLMAMTQTTLADDPIFLPNGPTTNYVAASNTTAATSQVRSTGDAWILGLAYSLESATSTILIKDCPALVASATSGITSATSITAATPVFRIGEEANKTGFIDFKYPIYAANGILLEATGARVNVFYVSESRRRKLMFR